MNIQFDPQAISQLQLRQFFDNLVMEQLQIHLKSPILIWVEILKERSNQ